jgi:hypothetical protein
MWVWSYEISNGHVGNVGEFVHGLQSDRGILEYRISIVLDAANAVMCTQEMTIIFCPYFTAIRMCRSNLSSLANHTVLAHTVVVRKTYWLCRFGLWEKNECADRSGHPVSTQHECSRMEFTGLIRPEIQR